MRPLPAPLSAVKKEQGTERRPAAASPAVRQPAGAEAASRPTASGRRRAVSGGAVRFPVASPGARGAGSASGAPLRLVQERSLPDVGGAVSVSRCCAQNGCERRARFAFWSREAPPSPARVRPGPRPASLLQGRALARGARPEAAFPRPRRSSPRPRDQALARDM